MTIVILKFMISHLALQLASMLLDVVPQVGVVHRAEFSAFGSRAQCLIRSYSGQVRRVLGRSVGKIREPGCQELKGWLVETPWAISSRGYDNPPPPSIDCGLAIHHENPCDGGGRVARSAYDIRKKCPWGEMALTAAPHFTAAVQHSDPGRPVYAACACRNLSASVATQRQKSRSTTKSF